MNHVYPWASIWMNVAVDTYQYSFTKTVCFLVIFFCLWIAGRIYGIWLTQQRNSKLWSPTVELHFQSSWTTFDIVETFLRGLSLSSFCSPCFCVHYTCYTKKKMDLVLNNLLRLISLKPKQTGPLWPGMVAPVRALSMGQIELKSVFMLNLITWNRTVLDIETVLR